MALRRIFLATLFTVATVALSATGAVAQDDSSEERENSGGNRVTNSDITGNQTRVGEQRYNTGSRGSGQSSSSMEASGSGGLDTSGASGGAAPAAKASGAAKAKPKSAGSAATTSGGALARTGSYTVQLALLGFGALLVGCLMVRYSWRPRMLVSASATHVREALSALADLHSRA